MNEADLNQQNVRLPVPTPGRLSTGTQSIERVVALLRALIPRNKRGATAAELAKAAGLDRTTAHRILKCLAREQLLSFSPDKHRYQLGPLAAELGAVASETFDLVGLCRPTLARIADDVGDTVFLMVRRGDDAVCADRVSGAYPVKTFVVDVGVYRPLGIGAGSMAILSALPPESAALLLEHNQARYTRYTPNLSDLRQLMEESRKRGYVVMDVIDVEGVRAVGMAVMVRDRPIAALSIAAISMRMTESRVTQLAALLRREATALGKMLERRMNVQDCAA
ncbi:IclR family transcriptional regulator [uncultured Pigmentiphaga sp.]|jgi:Transcriptional regulator|uniref:IclR family transcriptional regulator n=1 Tax=uncultured Pigmentiphaga sp. TaxID=340361 RepID=UPI002637F72E|nr:IclR family transcriptional regulator [uncultured Pigmentiphaga sp.]